MNLHACHRKWEQKDGGWDIFNTPHCEECCARALLGSYPWAPHELAGAIETLQRCGSLDFQHSPSIVGLHPRCRPSRVTLERVNRIVRALPYRLAAFGLAMSMRGRR